MKTLLPLLAALITTAGAQIAQPIINGTDAAPGEFPSTVSIVDGNEANNLQAHSCGGTLIHPRWVLTAAHCFTEDETIRPALASDPRDFQVFVGTHDLENGGRRIDVLRVIIHPDYDPVDSNNDIALLLLAEDVTDIPTTALVRQDGFTDPMTTATVTGWGNTDPTEEGESFPTILQKVDVPIATLEVANELEVYGGTLTANMLPAGDPTKQEDSCQGDSGGPLYVPDGNGSRLLAGIVSFGVSTREGFSCGNTFGIYTKVQNYTPWIDSYLTPTLYQWGLENEVPISHGIDTDGDGSENFLEYAFRSDPRDPSDTPGTLTSTSFSTLFPITPQVEMSVEANQDFVGPWGSFTGEIREISDGTTIGSAYIFEPGSRYFFRTRTTCNPSFEPSEEILSVPGAATNTIVASPTALAQARYLLEIPPALVGSEVTLTVRSEDFVPLITLSDVSATTTGTTLTFIPVEGDAYWFTVESDPKQAQAFGSFTIAAFTTITTTIASGETISGSLDPTDPPLPLPVSSGIYPADTYIINGVSQGNPLAATITSDVDLTIEVIDRETGRLLSDSGDGQSVIFNVDRSIALRVSAQREEPTASLIPYSLTLGDPVTEETSLVIGTTTDGSLSEGDATRSINGEDRFLDSLTLPGVTAGEIIDLVLTSGNFTPFLDVISPTGNTISSDELNGPGDGAATSFVAPIDGDYVIDIFSFDDSATGTYSVTPSLTPTVAPDSPFNGSLNDSSNDEEIEIDGQPITEHYQIVATTGLQAGTDYQIDLDSSNLSLGYSLTRDDGSFVQTDFDFVNGNFIVSFEAEANTVYFISVSEEDGASGSYTLSLSPK